MLIPLYSPTIKRSEMDAVLTCLVEEKVGPGEMAEKLEKRTAEFFSVPYAASIRSPAIALTVALKLLQLPEKAHVAVSALAPAWQYTQILHAGFTPVALDVDKTTALVLPDTLQQAITHGVQAFVMYETLGNLPNFDEFSKLGIPIIEDISQSAGAMVADGDITDAVLALEQATKAASVQPQTQSASENSPSLHFRQAGTFGTVAILGLEERDILTAGCGAVIFCADRRTAAPLKSLIAELLPTDRLPDINAALGFVQLKNLTKNLRAKLQMEKLFRRALQATKHSSIYFAPNVLNPVYNFPVILERGYKDVEKYAIRKQIEIAPAFARSIIAQFGDGIQNCENAASLALRTALFPLYPRLGVKKAESVAKVIGTLP